MFEDDKYLKLMNQPLCQVMMEWLDAAMNGYTTDITQTPTSSKSFFTECYLLLSPKGVTHDTQISRK